jgi:tRNA(fMet)-specific endonuclease VapC
MLYILDTVSLGMFERRHPATLRRVHEMLADGNHQVVTTIVTVEEKMDGWLLECRKAQTGQARLRALEELSGAVDLWLQREWLPFTPDAAVLFDQHIWLKKLIGARDLSIAAIALSVGGTVVTRNYADFSRVPNLKFEDWAIEPLRN